MDRRTFSVSLAAAVAAAALALSPANAATVATPSGQPTAAEKPFVEAVTADLNARFPTTADAVKAGYIRYTDEDDTGAISYANREWASADEKHPSQLWYDAKGRLIGADFSTPYAATRPTMFGLDPMRWQRFGAHVHYGLVGPSGTIYGATGAKAMAKAGASIEHPTPAALVAAGIAKKENDVRFVFAFPAIWDVSLWLVPNSDGAFADKNPDVKPVNSKAMPM